MEAVVNSLHNGSAPHAVAQIGEYSDQRQVAPDQDKQVLLAQISGNGVDYDLFTLNLVVGTHAHIAAGNREKLQYQQQFAVERLVTVDIPIGPAIVVLVGYALVYCLPCIVLIAVGAAFGDSVRPRLNRLYTRLGAQKVVPANRGVAVLWLLLAAAVMALAFLW